MNSKLTVELYCHLCRDVGSTDSTGQWQKGLESRDAQSTPSRSTAQHSSRTEQK